MERTIKIKFEDEQDYIEFCDKMTLTDREYTEAEDSKNVCCEKEMICLGEQQTISDMNTNKLVRYICSECGSLVDIKEYALDDEELWDLIKDEEKLKDSQILKEMKEDLEK